MSTAVVFTSTWNSKFVTQKKTNFIHRQISAIKDFMLTVYWINESKTGQTSYCQCKFYIFAQHHNLEKDSNLWKVKVLTLYFSVISFATAESFSSLREMRIRLIFCFASSLAIDLPIPSVLPDKKACLSIINKNFCPK